MGRRERKREREKEKVKKIFLLKNQRAMNELSKAVVFQLLLQIQSLSNYLGCRPKESSTIIKKFLN